MTRRTNSDTAVRRFFADNPDATPTTDELAAKLKFSPKTVSKALYAMRVQGLLGRSSIWHRKAKA